MSLQPTQTNKRIWKTTLKDYSRCLKEGWHLFTPTIIFTPLFFMSIELGVISPLILFTAFVFVLLIINDMEEDIRNLKKILAKMKNISSMKAIKEKKIGAYLLRTILANVVVVVIFVLSVILALLGTNEIVGIICIIFGGIY